MKAPKPKSTYEAVPAGTHVATLYSIVNLGTSSFEFKGEMKTSTKIRLTFELPGEMREFGEDKVMKPMAISREFGFSMGKKSHLRPFVEGMLGVALHDEEAYAFDIEDLLGRSCLLSVSHTEKDGNVYSNINSASPLMKGMASPTGINATSLIDVNTATPEQIEALPGFLRDKIKASEEWKARQSVSDMDAGIPPFEDNIANEDNPFAGDFK